MQSNIHKQTVCVLGAGSWGTALAIHLARNGHEVKLWGNEAQHIEQLKQAGCNQQYLPDIAFPQTLSVSANLKQALTAVNWVLFAIPSHAYRNFLKENAALFSSEIGVAWASKGLEQNTGKLLHQVFAEELPNCHKTAVLSGPTFAKEVAQNLPTAITVASHSDSFCQQLSDCLHNEPFRVYRSNDIIGVELGGAIKNVIAIATGAADGLGFGANTRAALITRGLAEIMRLGQAMGGKRETFMGLAGMGDLILTCTDNQSRNRQMGLLIAKGYRIEQAKKTIKQAVEGLKTAQEVVNLAHKYNIETPISEQVYQVIYNNRPIDVATHNLLDRKSSVEII